RGLSTGPHRSRRSAVAFQGRSRSPGATLGVPVPVPVPAPVPCGGGAGGAKGSGNLLSPVVGSSADGSSPALTAPRCPPRDGDEGHVPAWGRPAVGPGLRLQIGRAHV